MTRATILPALLALACACGPTAARAAPRRLLDLFSFPGRANILAEEHFGIVGGRQTVGIPYRDLAAVDGLWAPPYVSSDLRLRVRLWGADVPADEYTWLPFTVERSGTTHGVHATTQTVALAGRRAVVVRLELRNASGGPAVVPVEVGLAGTLDRTEEWGFARPESRTATAATLDGDMALLSQGELAMAARVAGQAGRWDADGRRWRAEIPLRPRGRAVLAVVVAIGPTQEARTECEAVAASPKRAIAATRQAWDRRARDLFARLPRLEADDARLIGFYNRSLVHFLTNRWDVPEFVLHPYYSTGSVKGGCTCNYLWNYGEAWELFPLYDRAAARSHIVQFLKCDIGAHFAFDPMAGHAFGPWYPVNQEKIVGSIYYYVLHTGDAGFLDERVAGKRVLDWLIEHTTLRDDVARPVALIDYGPSNSHLELRRGYPYNHVMPDLNGRRYAIYLWAHELSVLGGRPAPWLLDRAAQLKSLLRARLWDPRERWFAFLGEGGKRDVRYTIQVYKLFGSGVLDEEEQTGLLSHLNDEEFLSAYGFHSMSKRDPAYDQVDVDNGGGGACTSFPPQVIEKLYRAGRPREAEGILERILWWGQRMPYWGDSIVANAVDYRRDTPLQCTFDGVAAAQCLVFGMFGVRAQADGSIVVDPRPPAFSPRVALRGLRLRGRTLDIEANGGTFTVRYSGRTIRSTVGVPVTVPVARQPRAQ